MNCSEAAERITALVDGELPAGERAGLERHLEGCASCREFRAAEEAVAARLRATPRPAAPPRLRDAVMARVAEAPLPAPGEAAPAGRILPLWAWVVAGASTAAAVLAMIVAGPGNREGATVAADASGPPAALSAPAPAAGLPAPRARVPGAEATFGAEAAGPPPGEGTAGNGAPGSDILPGEPEEKPGWSRKDGEAVKEGKAEPPVLDEAEDESRVGARAAPAPAAPVPAPAPAPEADAGKERAPDLGAPPGGKPDAEKADGGPPEGAAGGFAGGPREKKSPERRPGDRTRGAAEAGAKTKPGSKARPGEESGLPAESLPRQAVFFRADDLVRGQRSVESVLFALKDFPHQREPWVRASELETDYGRVRRSLEAARESRLSDDDAEVVDALLPGEKVLQIRMQGKDVDRLRAALGKDPVLTETHAQVIAGLLDKAIPELQDELRRAALAAEEGRKDAAPAPAGGDAGAAGPGAAVGGGVPAPPGEPVPPPLPTKEQLEKLAQAPRREQPAAAGGKGGGGPGGEMILEIHVFENTPALAPPAPPAGGAPR